MTSHSLPDEPGHCFDVRRVREHVDGLDPLHAIASARQIAQVANPIAISAKTANPI